MSEPDDTEALLARAEGALKSWDRYTMPRWTKLLVGDLAAALRAAKAELAKANAEHTCWTYSDGIYTLDEGARGHPIIVKLVPAVKLASATRRIADLEEMVDSTAVRNLKVTAELATAREAALEEAAKACEGEALRGIADPPHDHKSDDAYDMAVGHCAAAIRALAQRKA